MLEKLRSLFEYPSPHSPAEAKELVGRSLPEPVEQKDAQAPIIFPRADFIPIDAAANTIDVRGLGSPWYEASWLAYACMSYRSTKLIEAPLWIVEEGDEGEKWLPGDHPLARVLEQPNPDQEMSDLLELTSLYLDSAGSCAWVKTRDNGGRVALLYAYSGDDVRAFPADGRLYGRFEILTARGWKPYAADDVVYFRSANPADPYSSVSPLSAALSRLGIERTLATSIRAGLVNSVVPGLVLSYQPEAAAAVAELTPEQRRELEAEIAAAYAGARNHGRSFIAGSMIAEQMKIGFSDLSGGELGKEVEAAVCACFKLPPVVVGAFVGLANSSDRHNLETSVELAYDNAIIPSWSRIEKTLTRALLRPVDGNPRRFIRFDKSRVKALQDDIGKKAEIVAKAAPALRVIDARTMLGLEPLGDDRDEILLKSARKESDEEPAAGSDEKRRRPRLEGKATALADDVAYMIFDEITRAQEFGWEAVVADQLESEKRRALDMLQAEAAKMGAGPTEAKADPDPVPADVVRRLVRNLVEFTNGTVTREWENKLPPLITATGARAVSNLAANLGISFDLLQPGLEAYTKREAAWLVTQVTDTTKEGVRRTLAAGLVEGESIDKLAARIEGGEIYGRTRATLIARTETTRVTNGGQRESLEAYAAETGDVVTKRWLATNDDRTRDEHRAMNGETKKIAEEFSNGLQAPGEPNCRCTLVYSIEAAG